MDESVIFASRELRAAWPRVATSWRRQYPFLFDKDDLRIARTQPRNHFAEWFAAIHLFQQSGVLALVEKYAFGAHRRKVARMHQILDATARDRLEKICRKNRCQPPDLLLYDAGNALLGFAEVKGPGDWLRPRQERMLAALECELEVPVRSINVRLVAL